MLDDPPNVADGLRRYVAGFSQDVRDIFEKFDLDVQVARLDAANLLYLVLGKFVDIDLGPGNVSNTEMGYIYDHTPDASSSGSTTSSPASPNQSSSGSSPSSPPPPSSSSRRSSSEEGSPSWTSPPPLGFSAGPMASEMMLPVWLRLFGALQKPVFNFKIVR